MEINVKGRFRTIIAKTSRQLHKSSFLTGKIRDERQRTMDYNGCQGVVIVVVIEAILKFLNCITNSSGASIPAVPTFFWAVVNGQTFEAKSAISST